MEAWVATYSTRVAISINVHKLVGHPISHNDKIFGNKAPFKKSLLPKKVETWVYVLANIETLKLKSAWDWNPIVPQTLTTDGDAWRAFSNENKNVAGIPNAVKALS